jgi:tetratricopeptide (TPR) repeat protein
MRTRIFLALAAALLILFDLGFVVVEGIRYNSGTTNISPTPTVTAIVSPSASATGTVSPSPQATTTPTFSQQISADEHSVFDPFLAVLAFDAAIVIAVLVVFLLFRIGYLSGLTNFVIDTFGNATGDEKLDKVLTGLNQLTRERLIQVLKQTSITIKKYKNRSQVQLLPPVNSLHNPEQHYSSLDNTFAINQKQFPVPEKASDVRLNTLLSSLSNVTSGEINTAIQLLMNLVFTPRGVKVTPTLQSKADTPPTLGISLEVADLQGDQDPVLYTIWEQLIIHDGVSSSLPIAGSPPATPTLPPQQARSYYDLGVQLDTLGIYEDAINYFEEALKRDKKFTEAAKALAASVSCLQVQQSGASAYTVGKKLQDAGLLLEAIESYKKPLPTAVDQANAEKAWKVVLKLSTDGQSDTQSEAKAYLILAKLYRQDKIYLFDQSLDLYKAAVALGSGDAEKELKDVQQKEAAELTEAAYILYGLTQYDAAEKYLKAALAKEPGDSGAQTMLATVKQSKPPEENKDAQAYYTLGQLYEERGALDQAKSQYESALTKQPDFERAKDALKRVLQTRKTSEDRYLALVEPVARGLAIEIAQRSMEADSKDKRHRAEVYNFIGAYHQSSAQAFKDFTFFYNLAIDDFKNAINLVPEWFQPYENLADTYVMIAQAMMVLRQPHKNAKKEEGRLLRPSAIVHTLSRGLITPTSSGYESIVGQTTPSVSDNQDLIIENLYKALTLYRMLNEKPLIGSIDQTSKRLIQVGECSAQLMTGDKGLVLKAKGKIKEIQPGILAEKDSRLLYNLACWYGMTHYLPETYNTSSSQKFDITDAVDPTQSALQAARRYVTYSLALDPDSDHDLWNWAPQDPSLAYISDANGWKKLTSALTKKTYEVPNLSQLEGDKFKEAIDGVLEEAGWFKEKE